MRAGWLLVLVGCGRIAFDAGSDASDATQDTVPSDVGPLDDRVFEDFSSCPQGLALVGDAECVGAAVRLTDEINNSTGGFWLLVQLPTDVSFAIEARVQIDSMDFAADGFAIVLHADPRGTSALGGFADGLGYAGIQPSVAVEVDPYPNGAETEATVGVTVDGDATAPLVSIGTPVPIGSPATLWVDYSAVNEQIAVNYSAGPRPGVPQLLVPVDLPRFGSLMWLGTTAATGGEAAVHRVLSLRVDVMP